MEERVEARGPPGAQARRSEDVGNVDWRLVAAVTHPAELLAGTCSRQCRVISQVQRKHGQMTHYCGHRPDVVTIKRCHTALGMVGVLNINTKHPIRQYILGSWPRQDL